MTATTEEVEVRSSQSPPAMPKSTRPRSRTKAAAAERVVLTGFMGSGKSTVGGLLAERLGWHFLDLDQMIEERTGQTVAQLFADRGEQGFRKEETLALAAALRRTHAVIALGGGAPETLSNRLLLEQTPGTAVVYLAASLAVLIERCERQGADPSQTVRPLLADAAHAEARFDMRQPLYLRLAHHVTNTEGDLPGDTVEKILALIAFA